MPLSPDVLIVGAGPAGATAARALAHAGARVRILERGRFPRSKPCGGAISVRALRRFPYLRDALPEISTHLISTLHLESPAGEHVTVTSPRPAALMIRRIEFDHLLARLAVRAGAELVEDAEVVQAEASADGVRLTDRRGRRFEAPLVVAADGVHSLVGRRLGLNAGWARSAVAVDMMEETPSERLQAVDPGSLWVSYGHGGGHGYAYVFPKKAHVNVGIGYVVDYFRRAAPGRPYDLQAGFVDDLRRRGVLRGQSDRRTFTPFLIPVAGPLRQAARDRVMAVGDAGGFVNGFTAEGIYYAMVSGELAGRALAGRAGSSKARAASPARAYERAWRREIGRELRDSVVLQRFLFRDPARIDAMVRGARAHPALVASMVRCMMGDVSYPAARRRLLVRFPWLAVRLVATSIGRWREPPSPAVVGRERHA